MELLKKLQDQGERIADSIRETNESFLKKFLHYKNHSFGTDDGDSFKKDKEAALNKLVHDLHEKKKKIDELNHANEMIQEKIESLAHVNKIPLSAYDELKNQMEKLHRLENDLYEYIEDIYAHL